MIYLNLYQVNLLTDSYISYINLRQREDRQEHMIRELKRVNIQADRFEAYTPDLFPDAKYDRMRNTTPGAIGCHMSQIAVMMLASAHGQHAMVMEDDLIFSDDFHKRVEIMEQFLQGKTWDIVWWGNTHHIEPTWHNTGHRKDFPCECDLNRDWEPTEHPNVTRAYGLWGTYCYTVNKNSIDKVLMMLDKLMPVTIGIDYSMMAMQPELITYSCNPGAVKQYNNRSNIGAGWTNFENFSKLGSHWFSEKL